ncbi:cysteine synthase A [Rickettsiales bacterium]|nr:cysteine synthase A [Rickettsiales bacterium]
MSYKKNGRNDRIFNSISETIGNTPLVRLNRIKNKYQLYGDIFAKLEFFNPLSSVKDRIGLSMIENAEKKGLLKKGSTVIEPTSGNTGISLASICASKGYRLILTMPESMSVERKKMLQLLGAKLILTPAKKGMRGSLEKAKEIHNKTKNSILLQQFSNPSNPTIHYETTAREIWKDSNGNIDNFVSGVGTGGTISGVAKFLKKKNSKIKIYAVEPEDSAVISGGEPGAHMIQGIGAGFIPDNLLIEMVDEIISINNNTAFEYAKIMARLEGIPVGISSGAALAAAIEINEQPCMKEKNTIVIIPSFAERYLSTPLFSDL